MWRLEPKVRSHTLFNAENDNSKEVMINIEISYAQFEKKITLLFLIYNTINGEC